MFQIWGIMGTSYSCCRVDHSWQQVIIGAAADQESGVASGQGQGDLLERVPGGLGLLLAFLPCQSCSQHLGLGKAPNEYFKGAPRVCQCLLLRLPFGSFLVLLMTHDEVCSGRGRLMRTSAVILMNECCPSQFYAGSPFLFTLLFHV